MNTSSPHTDGEIVTIDEEVAAEAVLAEMPEAQKTAFVIDTEDKANWLVRKVIELRTYRERVEVYATREKARALHEENYLMVRFEHQLRDWATPQIAAFRGRRQSLRLPAGLIGFRLCPARLVVDDEVRVIAWAKVHCPEAVAVVEKLSRSILKTYFETTGALPNAGAHVEPEGQDFYIR